MTKDREPAVLSWSGGKDSALALYELQQAGEVEVVALLTTLADKYDRVSHHGVRAKLLEAQAEALGVPLQKIYLPVADGPCTNNVYEEIMERAMRRFVAEGVRTVAFGDIFLEDLRQYREDNLARVDMRGLFPLWKRDTGRLARRFIDLGFQARVSCVEGHLGEPFAGRTIDESFLADLPPGVDPCGENGEYHTFVYDGPNFARPVEIEVGVTVCRDGRYYADLLPPGALQSTEPSEIPPI